MLSINHLDIRHGDKHLFDDVSVQVHRGNRIGLIGVNGAGKSTLLKIMAGVSATDDGVVSRPKHFSIGYLPQESEEFFSDRTLYQEAESAFAPLLALQQEIEELHDKINVTEPTAKEFQTLLHRQGEIQLQLEGSDLYAIGGKIEKVLLGLGFCRGDMDRDVSSFSGGWQMRLHLAKMLLEDPSLMLLDEPTNHLDLDSLTWVENFLKNCKGAMVIISHDRTFLDKVTDLTWEISLGRIETYRGNYSYYVREKAERRAIEKAAFDNQQAKIRQTQRFVERFRAKSTKAKQVQSRVKQLEKMDIIQLSENERQVRFTFPPAPPSGRDVLLVEDLSKSYGEKHVFSGADLLFSRGDKVAVVGVNGAGKSTFLKILAGRIDHDSGRIKLGANVKMSYFGQHQARELAPGLTVLQTMALAGEEMTVTRTRSLLGAFLFRGDDVEKKVSVLSGGEKSRLALAKMIAVPANLMLLDEPTNHLDMGSQEVLQEAMSQYDGTIVVVSHNRFFLDSFINRVLEVKDGKITVYEGSVAEYLGKQKVLQENAEKDRQNGGKRPGGKSAEKGESRRDRKKIEAVRRQERSKKVGRWRKQLTEAEKKIEYLEVKKEKLETLMADPELYSDEKNWATTSKDYDDCKRRLERWYDKWEEAQSRIDAIDEELSQCWGNN